MEQYFETALQKTVQAIGTAAFPLHLPEERPDRLRKLLWCLGLCYMLSQIKGLLLNTHEMQVA